MKILSFEQWVVRCPIDFSLTDVGTCADYCDYYEGDGKDEAGVPCSFER
jgi:hypothetical protein